MSGIVGGPGSKSGVIGETEIAYEEGAFTPTSTVSTSAVWGHYVKVGKVVHIWARWTFDASGGASLSGLPFTSSTIANNVSVMINKNVNWGTSVTTCTGYIGASSTTYNPLMSGDNVDWQNDFTVASGSEVILQLTYNTV